MLNGNSCYCKMHRHFHESILIFQYKAAQIDELIACGSDRGHESCM